MALPLLPGEHIAPAFEKLADTQLVAGNTAIQTLLEYVKITWIDSRLWPTWSLLECWCTDLQYVRTTLRGGTTG